MILSGDLCQLKPVNCDIAGYYFQAVDYEYLNKNMFRFELIKNKRNKND